MLQLVRDRTSSPELMTLWVAFLAARGVKEGITSVPMPRHDRRVAGYPTLTLWDQFTHISPIRANSIVVPG